MVFGVLAAVLFIPQKVVGGSEYCVSCGGSCIEAALTVQLDINVQELGPLALPIALGEELQLQLPMGELEMYQKTKKKLNYFFLAFIFCDTSFYQRYSMKIVHLATLSLIPIPVYFMAGK